MVKEIVALVSNINYTSCFEVYPNFDKEAFDKAFDKNKEFCLVTLNEDGEPIILFKGTDSSEIEIVIENLVHCC